eukprot:XP_001700941.1 predicted protein [Chlamydomonas reinhardtii]
MQVHHDGSSSSSSSENIMTLDQLQAADVNSFDASGDAYEDVDKSPQMRGALDALQGMEVHRDGSSSSSSENIMTLDQLQAASASEIMSEEIASSDRGSRPPTAPRPVLPQQLQAAVATPLAATIPRPAPPARQEYGSGSRAAAGARAGRIPDPDAPYGASDDGSYGGGWGTLNEVSTQVAYDPGQDRLLEGAPPPETQVGAAAELGACGGGGGGGCGGVGPGEAPLFIKRGGGGGGFGAMTTPSKLLQAGMLGAASPGKRAGSRRSMLSTHSMRSIVSEAYTEDFDEVDDDEDEDQEEVDEEDPYLDDDVSEDTEEERPGAASLRATSSRKPYHPYGFGMAPYPAVPPGADAASVMQYLPPPIPFAYGFAGAPSPYAPPPGIPPGPVYGMGGGGFGVGSGPLFTAQSTLQRFHQVLGSGAYPGLDPMSVRAIRHDLVKTAAVVSGQPQAPAPAQASAVLAPRTAK